MSAGRGARLADEASPGWTWARRGWAIAQLLTWIPRGLHLPENYSSAGVVLERGAWPLPRWVVLSEPTAWVVYGSALTALLLLLRGGWNRLALVVALATIWALNLHEGLNFKAYDRLLFWQGVVLLFAPGGGSGASGNPGARYAMMLVYAGIYGSTGWHKALLEPTWASGDVLRYALADNNFGLRPLGLLVTNLPGLVPLLGWGTLAFECLFPFLIGWTRIRPALLAAGAAMHLGIALTMHVNTFSVVALAAYPAMLNPPQFEALRALVRRLRWGLGALVVAGAAAVLLPSLVQARLGPFPARFHLPDKTLRAELRSDVEQLLERWTAAADSGLTLAQERWPGAEALPDGGWRWSSGSGPCLAAHLLDDAHHGPRDNAAGIAAVLAVSTRAPGTYVLYRDTTRGPESWGDACTRPIVLDSLGAIRHGAGTQRWPGLWAWVRPWVGDFYAVSGAGAAEVARAVGETTAIPLAVWPGEPLPGHEGPRGVVRITDTGGLRGRAPALDYDALALLVEGLAARR